MARMSPRLKHYKGARASGTNPRALGTNRRARGTNPKALGTNPCALGTNPKAVWQRIFDSGPYEPPPQPARTRWQAILDSEHERPVSEKNRDFDPTDY